MLILAASLIWLGNLHGPAFIRPFFDAVPFETPTDTFLFVGTMVAAMLVHEAGHFLASVLLGFRMLGASIGPFQLQVLHRNWKISYSARRFFTASVSAVPATMRWWRPRMMAVIAAGPLATLSAGLYATSSRTSNHSEMLLQISFVQVSLLLFALGLVPNSRFARQHNDCRLLLDLLLRDNGAEDMQLRVELKQRVLAGERPQDCDREVVERLAGFRGRPDSEATFALAMANWAMDSDELGLADAWDCRAFELSADCGPQIQNAARASSACFDVIFREDMQSAREKFGMVDCDALFPDCFAHRVRAAKEIAAGHLNRVAAHVLRAQYSLPKGITSYALERSLLERLHMKALTVAVARDQKFRTATA
jgi:hypothetical protein